MSEHTGNKEERKEKDKKKPSVLLRTYGCQMNEYDSELIRSILEGEGFVFVDDEKKADVILLNTCSVRDSAVRKVRGQVHTLRHELKNKKFAIGILGCIASHFREELVADPYFPVDFVVGPDNYRRLPELIRQALAASDKPALVDLSDYETYGDIYPKRKEGINAWLAIMRGCNNFCTFCVVPYTRGRERSLSPEAILSEAQRLADEGFVQVTLLGQNVNSYKYDSTDFVALLKKISAVEGIKRIRFMSPHPKDFPDALIEAIATNPKLCKHIHLPLQSGSTRILKLMNRKYTKAQYLDLAAKIRQRIPSLSLTTDIIVGFPSETDNDFKDTVDVMKKVKFDSAFIFKYSPRKGTVAAQKYKDDVPVKTKTARIVQLNKLQKEISLKSNKSRVGKETEILIEEESTSRSREDFQGRTDGNTIVIVPAGNYRLGEFVNVKITGASAHVLKGKPV